LPLHRCGGYSWPVGAACQDRAPGASKGADEQFDALAVDQPAARAGLPEAACLLHQRLEVGGAPHRDVGTAEVAELCRADASRNDHAARLGGVRSSSFRIGGKAQWLPAAIPYRDHMTVLDLMIEVKGLAKFADGNSAIIVRGVGDKRETIHVRLSDLLQRGDIDQNIELVPGDTLIIPQSWF